MIVTNKNVNTNTDICIGNDKLKKVDKFKYLGLIIDDKLKFQPHIIHTKAKLSQICGSSYRLKHFFNLSAARKFYYSCFYAIVTYCIVCYGGVWACSQRANILQNIQTKIVKNLFSTYYPSSPNLFKEAGLLKLYDVYKLRVATYMFRIMQLEELPAIRNNLFLRTADHEHNTRYANNFILPVPNVLAIKINFQYQFVDVWNNIPADIENSNTVKTFKNKLIQYYLNNY